MNPSHYPWLELTLTLREEQLPQLEAALDDLGVLSVTLLDAEDCPVLEPGPGEMPLWPNLTLVALFDNACDRNGLLHAIVELLPELSMDSIGCREVADQDWTRAWMDQFQPMRFGTHLWIYPWNIEPPTDANTVIVRLDPGLAFGTGTHPTTALCLEWLDSINLHGKHIVDYGCGSGVLAIAALKLGASTAIGVDNDPQALQASRENATRNAVTEHLELLTPDAFVPIAKDLLIANILAAPLAELAPCFAANIKPGGKLAISGILKGQEAELITRYAEWFEGLQIQTREEWVLISGSRRKTSA